MTPPVRVRRFVNELYDVGVLSLAGAMTMWGLVGMDALAHEEAPNNFVASPGIHDVVDYLHEQEETVVTTDTAGMQIHFLSGGDIVASSFGAPRVKEFEVLALAMPTTTFVLEDSTFNNPERLRTWAYYTGTPIATQEHIGSYWVFGFDRRVSPQEAGLVAYGGRPVPEAGGDAPE